MAWMQLDVKLTPAEIEEIVCFLGSLEAENLDDINVPAEPISTGPYAGTPNRAGSRQTFGDK